jgi:hypothetical protein
MLAGAMIAGSILFLAFVILLGVRTMSKLSDSVDGLTTAVNNELAAIKAVLSADNPDVTAAISQIDALTAALNDETSQLQPPSPPPAG